ncbi:segregation and condensation protein A [Marinibaculum pumilum]|uniref:Segregation and condensation protein A n=1 Tax=Marinibaculum pumilum TaxID=1766165 RepID=A0ABV7KWV9_9PROT
MPDQTDPETKPADPSFAEDDPRAASPEEAAREGMLVVDLEVYEGPLDVLLALARDQKVDLRQVSILALAEQYLTFVQEAKRLRLDIAADYLVMAAWLAYLKSRLLLPEREKEEEPSGAELAARLALRLQRLEAIREAAARLMARERIGVDMFTRGMPEGIRIVRRSVFACDLTELLAAYGALRGSRGSKEPLTLRAARQRIMSIEDALDRLAAIVGQVPEWTVLVSFLPKDLLDAFDPRSAIASTFVATLEMAKQGRLQFQQAEAFGPLYVRGVPPDFRRPGDETEPGEEE